MCLCVCVRVCHHCQWINFLVICETYSHQIHIPEHHTYRSLFVSLCVVCVCFSQFFPCCFMHAQNFFTLDFHPLLLFSFTRSLSLCVRAHSACVLFHFRLTKSDPFLVIIVRACCAGLRFMCVRKFHLCPLLTWIDSFSLYLFFVSLSLVRSFARSYTFHPLTGL